MFNGKLSLSIKTKILSTLRSPTVEIILESDTYGFECVLGFVIILPLANIVNR